MSITGTGSKSLRKADLINQSTPAVGFKKLVFAHKASAGETQLDLTALVTPTELSTVGFVQPTAAEFASAEISLFFKNVKLTSSARGELIPYLSYYPVSNTVIRFTDSFGSALANEIFVGTIDPVCRTGFIGVDAQSINVTGTLAANTDTFTIGKAFRVNYNPNQQVGDIEVFVDGQQQYRNVGNAAASPTVDGNFQEIDVGSGNGLQIKFNEVMDYDRAVYVRSSGWAVVQPDGSILQEIQKQQGQLDKIIAVLADVSGQPSSYFQSAPNNIDLAAFGTTVASHTASITDLTTRMGAQEAPTSMSDALATKLGYKQYLHGINYNAGIAPTVTSNKAGLSVLQTSFVPYQLQDGSWRMKFNIAISFTSSASTQVTATINGVTFAAWRQAISAGHDSGTALSPSNAYAEGNQPNCHAYFSSFTLDRMSFSGDVALANKPTWAY